MKSVEKVVCLVEWLFALPLCDFWPQTGHITSARSLVIVTKFYIKLDGLSTIPKNIRQAVSFKRYQSPRMIFFLTHSKNNIFVYNAEEFIQAELIALLK